MGKVVWASALLVFMATTGCASKPAGTEPSAQHPVDAAARQAATRTSHGETSLQSLIGKPCRVQFRRDALGMAVAAPLPPTSEGVGGRPAYLDGVVADVSESWVSLVRDGVTYIIPQAAILLIESKE